MHLKTQYCKMALFYKLLCKFSAILISSKIPAGFFPPFLSFLPLLKIYMKMQRT